MTQETDNLILQQMQNAISQKTQAVLSSSTYEEVLQIPQEGNKHHDARKEIHPSGKRCFSDNKLQHEDGDSASGYRYTDKISGLIIV